MFGIRKRFNFLKKLLFHTFITLLLISLTYNNNSSISIISSVLFIVLLSCTFFFRSKLIIKYVFAVASLAASYNIHKILHSKLWLLYATYLFYYWNLCILSVRCNISQHSWPCTILYSST